MARLSCPKVKLFVKVDFSDHPIFIIELPFFIHQLCTNGKDVLAMLR